MAALFDVDERPSWAALRCVEGLPVQLVGRALLRDGVETDSRKGEILPGGTLVSVYGTATTAAGVERVLVRTRHGGQTGPQGWLLSLIHI